MICAATGKVRHATRGAADAHARSIALQGKGLLFSYVCNRCGGWHVGHSIWAKDPKIRLNQDVASGNVKARAERKKSPSIWQG